VISIGEKILPLSDLLLSHEEMRMTIYKFAMQ
jgi:hypothetical protein